MTQIAEIANWFEQKQAYQWLKIHKKKNRTREKESTHHILIQQMMTIHVSFFFHIFSQANQCGVKIIVLHFYMLYFDSIPVCKFTN